MGKREGAQKTMRQFLTNLISKKKKEERDGGCI
jgi:hypothetical protein